MNHTLMIMTILGLTATLVAGGTTCATGEFLYNYSCLQKSCLQNDLSRLKLVASRGDNVGEFNLGFSFAIDGEVDANGEVLLKHTIYFSDIFDDPLLKPETCLDGTLFMIADDFQVDDRRLYVAGTDLKPSFPNTIYVDWDDSTSETMIYFYMTQNDLDTKGCVRQTLGGNYVYHCHWEFAITLAGRTQASYYFSSMITINTSLDADSLHADWTKIIENDKCYADDPDCAVTIRVDSELNFCSDMDCTERSPTQIGQLWVNKLFFIEHRISDLTYNNWILKLDTAVFTAPGFKILLEPLESIQKPGSTVHRFRVPLAQNDVKIAIHSQLQSPNGRRVLESRLLATTTNNDAQAHKDVQCIVQNEGDQCNAVQTATSQNQSTSAGNINITCYLLLLLAFFF